LYPTRSQSRQRPMPPAALPERPNRMPPRGFARSRRGTHEPPAARSTYVPGAVAVVSLALVVVPRASAAPANRPRSAAPCSGADGCVQAARNVVCGPAQPVSLGSALAGYEAALRSDRGRRGLGMPSLRQLFGPAGARAEALADGRLARRPVRRPPPAGAVAAALGRVGFRWARDRRSDGRAWNRSRRRSDQLHRSDQGSRRPSQTRSVRSPRPPTPARSPPAH